ncbi:hypothetical protein KOR42_06380 [Thalassoglobus neptunius]|uniref:Uncharacterized protein n=1 Tax=Thalassoglobus neptunius TaxID=1938619 RepID=A0A5C5X3X0_9PLAN|nr:hypothetical protein [Thalassoglobus neptunius]TWT57279.1 hypothetical protein KOR42_06380 [Thalassoglobus neptunius]
MTTYIRSLFVLTICAFSQLGFGEDPVRLLLETSNFDGPFIHGISNDGKYLAALPFEVARNTEGDVQFGLVPQQEKINGHTWIGAKLWPIFDIESTDIAVLISQTYEPPEEKENPFRKKLQPGFEMSLFPRVLEEGIVRFPTVSEKGAINDHGRVTNVWFGPPGSLFVTAINQQTHLNRLGSVEIDSKKMRDLMIDRVAGPNSRTPFTETFFSDGRGYFDTWNLRIYRYGNRSEQRTDIPKFFAKMAHASNQRVTLGPDEDCWLASYPEGVMLWDLTGKKMLKSTTFDLSVFPSDQGLRYATMLSKDRAAILRKEPYEWIELFLVDLNSGEVLDSRRIEDFQPLVNLDRRLLVANSGNHVCLLAENAKEMSDGVFCFKIADDKLHGPWRLQDPENNEPIEHVLNMVVAKDAPVMAFETKGRNYNGPMPEKPRIFAVDLNALTSQPPQE